MLTMKPVFTDALLQPKMRKRKSVTRLTEKATMKANKYVLATHGVDSDGDIATKYVKVRSVTMLCFLFFLCAH